MGKADAQTAVDAALAAESSAALRAALGRPRPDLTLPQIARLTARLRSFDEQRRPLRVGVLRTYATELLVPHWSFEAMLAGLDLALYEGPYGTVVQEGSPESGLARHAPDVTFVFLRAEDLDPAFVEPLSLLGESERSALAGSAAGRAAGMLAPVREAVSGTIVVTLLPPAGAPELGNYDAMAADSEAAVRFELKRALAARLRDELADVLFHDLDPLAADVGRARFFDARLWHSSRFPFSALGAQALVRDLMRYALRLTSAPAKCVVLDADNTLWGGIVGEDGPAGIALGPDYPGSCFVAFQQRLLRLRQRGLLLAMCSKNNEADVLEVLRSHPHQVLREEHFAALRVDWEPKPANLERLARDLNLGVDSFVFVDDSPHECHAVRSSLPAVTVVQAPADPLALPTCLDDEPRLEIVALTSEDRDRARMYGEERQRQELAAGAGSVEEYLASLDMEMTVRVNDGAHLARVAQLTQKTNQFNLTTRRHGEGEVAAFMEGPDSFVMSFSLRDVFGDSGLVGVAIVTRADERTAEIETFLMSCRVIGRRAEQAFLRTVLDACAERGFEALRASYLPTPKNAQVERFWPENGFVEIGEGRYEMTLGGPDDPAPAPPIRVRVEAGRAPSRSQP